MKETIELGVGLLIIFVYTYIQFNTPSTNRSSTTALRFHMAAFTYFLSYLLGFLIIAKFPEIVTVGLKQNGDAATNSIQEIHKAVPLLGLALVITVVLPKIPGLNKVDTLFRGKLWEFAAIPSEENRISARLRDSGFTIPDSRLPRVLDIFKQNGFNINDNAREMSGEPQKLLTRVITLMDGLHTWETYHGLSGYLVLYKDDYQSIHDKYTALLRKAKICLELIRETRKTTKNKTAQYAVKVCTETFKEQAIEILDSVYHFISRGILHTKLTHKARYNTLLELGFTKPLLLEKGRITTNRIVTLLISFIGVLGLDFILMSKRVNINSNFDMALLVTMVATIYCAAILCAVGSKRKWDWTLRDENDTRPAPFYLFVGFISVLAAVAIVIFFRGLISMDLIKDLAFYKAFGTAAQFLYTNTYPFLLLSFVMASTLAFQLDNRVTKQLAAYKLQWIEALSQAVISLIAAVIVVNWLSEAVLKQIGAEPIGIIVGTTIIGLVIGYFVPTWYRSNADEGPKRAKKKKSRKGKAKHTWGRVLNYDFGKGGATQPR